MKRTRKIITLPFEPLRVMFNTNMSDGQIAEAISKNRANIARWRAKGLPIYTADKVACTIGVHPSYIWGEDWWTAEDVGE